MKVKFRIQAKLDDRLVAHKIDSLGDLLSQVLDFKPNFTKSRDGKDIIYYIAEIPLKTLGVFGKFCEKCELEVGIFQTPYKEAPNYYGTDIVLRYEHGNLQNGGRNGVNMNTKRIVWDDSEKTFKWLF